MSSACVLYAFLCTNLITYFRFFGGFDLVKTERMHADQVEPTPGNAWMIGAVAWFVPGLGHALQKRWFRAALMGGAVWLSFFVGLQMKET